MYYPNRSYCINCLSSCLTGLLARLRHPRPFFRTPPCSFCRAPIVAAARGHVQRQHASLHAAYYYYCLVVVAIVVVVVVVLILIVLVLVVLVVVVVVILSLVSALLLHHNNKHRNDSHTNTLPKYILSSSSRHGASAHSTGLIIASSISS